MSGFLLELDFALAFDSQLQFLSSYHCWLSWKISCLISGMTLHLIRHIMFHPSVSGQYVREKLGREIFLLPVDIYLGVPSRGRAVTNITDLREGTLFDWSYLSHSLSLESDSVRGIA